MSGTNPTTAQTAFKLLPAIDLKDGRCVRLLQGRAEDETVYSDDPVAVARRWAAAGVPELHIVNLDGAFEGNGADRNTAIIRDICAAIETPVQLGGGIRSLDAVTRAFESGVGRVVLGTALVHDPELLPRALERYGEAIVVGIDALDGQVAIRGWRELADIRAVDLARQVARAGVRRIVFTDIRRDGMLTGPNLDALVEMAHAAAPARIIASGGISSLDDLRDLLRLVPDGIEGAITGKALYTGAIRIEEAVNIIQSANS